jgi:hypothetical protein
MSKNLERLAQRLEDDPFFLACPLSIYAKSEGLDVTALAARLRCPKENLSLVYACRSPAGDSDAFQDDVDRVAAKFALDADVLAEAIRRGQAILLMQRAANLQGTLLAARDGDNVEHDSGGTKS